MHEGLKPHIPMLCYGADSGGGDGDHDALAVVDTCDDADHGYDGDGVGGDAAMVMLLMMMLLMPTVMMLKLCCLHIPRLRQQLPMMMLGALVMQGLSAPPAVPNHRPISKKQG